MRAIIADDHPLYREAVRLRLERLYPSIEVIEVATVDTLVASAAAQTIDLVLVDLHMPGMDEGEAIGRVVDAVAPAPVVLVSGLATPANVRRAIALGARGFFPKTMAADLFANATALVVSGGSYLPVDILQPDRLAAAPADPSGTVERQIASLTPRERDVLVLLTSGASNKEIGRDMELAEVTVKLHVRRILQKIGARNRSEAAVFATKAGLGESEATSASRRDRS